MTRVQNYRIRTTGNFRVNHFEFPEGRTRTSPKAPPATPVSETVRRRRNPRFAPQPLKQYFALLLDVA